MDNIDWNWTPLPTTGQPIVEIKVLHHFNDEDENNVEGYSAEGHLDLPGFIDGKPTDGFNFTSSPIFDTIGDAIEHAQSELQKWRDKLDQSPDGVLRN